LGVAMPWLSVAMAWLSVAMACLGDVLPFFKTCRARRRRARERWKRTPRR
jgi:hypothetical protein